jgi:regulator of protease activity HflC (stomatin/prohibitin superfamily)
MSSRVLTRLRGLYRRRVVGFWLSLLALALVILYLLPSIVVTIPAGHAGVLWRRFGLFGALGNSGGTSLDPPMGEGTHYKLPWNHVQIYDIRLQDVTRTFGVIANDGLTIQTEISIRFRPMEMELGRLHRYVGPDYIDVLVVPELGAHARKQISHLSPAELYSGRREELEQAIQRNMVEEFQVRFEPAASLLGAEAHMRREIIRLAAEAPTPMTAADVARQLHIDVVELVHQDLAALVRDGLLHESMVNGQPFYRINSEKMAAGTHLNDLLGTGSPLIYVEDVLIRHIELPPALVAAIQGKLVTEQEMLEYDFRIMAETKEKERKRLEAEGIRAFQDIVTEGISDRYLKWKGIDATLELAKSPNSKVVIIGSAGDGLPIILGPLETAPSAVVPRPPAPASGGAGRSGGGGGATPTGSQGPGSGGGGATPTGTPRPPGGGY